MVCIVQSHSYSQLTQKKGNIVYLTIPYQYVTVDDLTCCIMTGDNSATITAWLFTHSHNVILNIRKALSHWCVFHHRYCRLVVETWDCEFHVASSERRLSLLYLANDIMQNSRKEGNGYITEFMRVIPAALNEVLTIRDDLGRNVVKRLVCSTYSWYQCSWKSIRFHVLHNCVFTYHVHNNYVDNFMSILMCLHYGKVTRMANAKLITQWYGFFVHRTLSKRDFVRCTFHSLN